ncbi:hypothetical protein ACQJBY_035102 [Aegilops geniculata]
MEPIKPTTLTSKIRVQHEPADGEDASSGTIGGLPFHLTEKTLGCISPLESVRLAAVCKSWAATVSERLARPTPHLLALKVSNERFQLPPVEEPRRVAIFPFQIDGEGSPSAVVPLPARVPSMVCDVQRVKLSGALHCGGLSFEDDNHVVPVNPVTGAFQSEMYAPVGTTEAKARVAAGANAVFVNNRSEMSVSLFWCTEEWPEEQKLISEKFKSIYLMAYTDDVFYALEFWGCTYTVDTRVPPPWRLKKLHVPNILEQYTPICGYHFLWYTHLLESDGSVLFVGPVLAPQEPTCLDTIHGFEVYRLDVEEARWIKVERLAADRALFVSEQSSFTVRASEIPGCMSNCIYFVGEVDYYSWVTWGVYSMEERKVLFQQPVGGSPGMYEAARWFLPAVLMPLAHARSDCRHSGKKRKI